ncbi:MAG: hypothetical protein JSU59_05595, partial [Nitrospirota bacterium]
SPYFGGGLSGVGFGITLDPRGRVWVGNFGFQAPACGNGMVPPDHPNKIPATHNSVSLFRSNGVPLSGSQGFTKGHISWPQATVSDRKGNIWIANCGNDTVTIYPKGHPWRSKNISLGGDPLPPLQDPSDPPRIKPFGIAIDPNGNAWVTGNKSQAVYRISSHGKVVKLQSDGLISWPMGISGDSQGNMWVSNSDSVDIPCNDEIDPQSGENPSIVLYPAQGGQPRQFTGGGISIPWGNAVDGNDTLWVFNFGHNPFNIGQDFDWPLTALSHFCGTGKCPAGLKVGDPISPSTGYTSDALERMTGGAVDPSGNLWLLNNWKINAPFTFETNPGGNSFVIVPGAAKPVKTPLIGPPRTFDNRNRWNGKKVESLSILGLTIPSTVAPLFQFHGLREKPQ